MRGKTSQKRQQRELKMNFLCQPCHWVTSGPRTRDGEHLRKQSKHQMGPKSNCRKVIANGRHTRWT